MKCPMISVMHKSEKEFGVGLMTECYNTDCAWWDSMVGECSIKSLAMSMRAIDAKIDFIMDEMPTKQTFAR